MRKSIVFFLVFCVPVLGCNDAPTPITISGSTFEDQDLRVSASGLQFSEGLIAYDLKLGDWCFKPAEGNPVCKLREMKFKAAQGPNKGLVVGAFRFAGRAAYLYQAKRPFEADAYRSDEESAHFVFSDRSASPYSFYGSDRLSTRVVDKLGIMGTLVSTRIRSAKDGAAPKVNEKLDMRKTDSYSAGCGGLFKESSQPLQGLSIQPDQQFEYSSDPPVASDQEMRARSMSRQALY